MRRLLVLVFALLPPLAAAAVDIKATLLTDGVDVNLSDDVCDIDTDTSNNVADPDQPGEFIGQCTLRAALQTANARPGPDRILLRGGQPGLRYLLNLAGPGEDASASGDLDVTSEVEIDGTGYQATLIEGKKLKDRIFDVKPGGKLTLKRLSLLDGKTPKDDFDPGAPGEVSGGCVRSEGALVIDQAFFFRCTSSDDGGALSIIGGTADLANVIFHTCRAKNEGGALAVTAPGQATVSSATAGFCRAGTGAFAAARGPLTLRLATLMGNQAKLGGAVAVLGGAAATIRSSTIASNGKVNVDGSDGTLTIGNSIVWGAKTDCVGTIVSDGGNLEGATSCGFTNTNDQQSQDPLLAALENNGGAVPTAALLATSPAIDHGVDPAGVCSDMDARGLLRVDVAGLGVGSIDSGAYEFGGAPPSFSITSTPILTATEGVAYTYDVDASDPGRAACRVFSLSTAPTGMTITPDTGVISWTPTAGQLGNNGVTVNLAETVGGPQQQTFTINVVAAAP